MPSSFFHNIENISNLEILPFRERQRRRGRERESEREIERQKERDRAREIDR